MQSTKKFLALGILISFLSCKNRDTKDRNTSNDSISANTYISSSAAVENNKDSTRKFIRTANLKFKVKSVIKSTYDIENTINQQGGFVTYTNLASNIDNVTTRAISADSSIETTYYTVTNSIILRVPNTKLDTTLKAIAKNIDYLDYRVIKAEDVALQIFSNNLTQKRATKNKERLTNAIDNRGKKLDETTTAEEALLNKQEQADNAMISNLSLTDQTKFSTVNLLIYQRQDVKRELIATNKNLEIDEYQPSFASKMFKALQVGWDMIKEFIIFLTNCWALFLFLFVIYVIYKKYKPKKK